MADKSQKPVVVIKPAVDTDQEAFRLTVESADTKWELQVYDQTSGMEIKRMIETATGFSPIDQKFTFINPVTNAKEVFSNEMTIKAADFNHIVKHANHEPAFHLELTTRGADGKFADPVGMEQISDTRLVDQFE